jgi:hypothetical protein
MSIFTAGTNASTALDTIEFSSSDKLDIYSYNGSYTYSYTTSQVFRDPSAWLHLVVNFDSTNGVAGDRLKVYVNGFRVTAFDTSTNPGPNVDTSFFNNTNAHYLGYQISRFPGDFYLANIHFIDGQALTPASFAETDATTGAWNPVAYTGSYGTNGFYLRFNDNSTTAALGTDSSGNGNTWTTNNFSVTAGAGNDSLVDSPTNYGTDTGVGGEVRGNYCTWNPLKFGGDIQASTNGNLDVTSVGSATGKILGTIGVSSGKWYWESMPNSSANIAFGVTKDNTVLANYPGQDAVDYSYLNDGSKYNNGSGSAYGASYTTNDIIGVAFDADNGTLTFYKNNSTQGQAYSGLTSGPYFPMVGDPSSTPDISATTNFGQRAFAYTAPSGFKALCTQNLPAPLVTKPSTVFDVITYTGTGSSLTLPNGSSTPTSIAFTPDFVWLKGRSGATDHAIYDSIRDVQKDLVSNSTAAETTQTTGLTAFGTNTFTVGSLAKLNTSSATYVGWCWDGGTSIVANTAGSITGGSQVRANPTAGFSVVTFTAQSSGSATIGHGLGVEPHLIIVKSRVDTYSWLVYHKYLTSNAYYLILNSTAAQSNASNAWNSTTPTSTVFTLGSTYAGGANTVAYCFAPVVGYSNFGSYVGNGSSDGVFVFTGFRSRYIMIKRSSEIGDWVIYDSVRLTYNASNVELYANSSGAEIVDDPIDILSNGFKIRTTGSGVNSSGNTYVFAAFAESPFNYSRAR